MESEEEKATRIVLDVSEGDVIIIPSGVAHRCLSEGDGFSTVGSYPSGGKQWDMNYGGEDKQVEASVPEMDPVRGKDGEGLTALWGQSTVQ